MTSVSERKEPQPPQWPSKECKHLASASVTLNFVKKKRMREAVLDYIALSRNDRPAFDSFLVGRKLLTPREVKMLQSFPDTRILRCPKCPQEFDITSVEPGSQFECPVCSEIVTVPSETANIDVLFDAHDKQPPLLLKDEDFRPPGRDLKTEQISRELEKLGFKVIRIVGRGGMGIVYLARDESLKREVALKVLLAGSFASDGQTMRFEREAKAVAALKHPNIVSIHTLGEFMGQKYFTMDYIEGISLDKAIFRSELDLQASVNICVDVCNAVHYAHEAGIIHRDLKPANILLDSNKHPYVTDFGLAKFDDKKRSITETGTALGTPHYMSPEQASGRVSSTDARTDVYSIGVMLYELLCGRVPFDGERSMDVLMKVIHDEPKPPSEYDKTIPDELEAICLKAIAKDPDDRYSTAREMARDLNSFLSGQTVLAKPRTAFKRVIRRMRKARFIAVVLFLMVISIAGTYIVLPTGPDNTAILERLTLASVAVAEGDYERSARAITLAQEFPEDAEVSSAVSRLKDKLKEKLSGEYAAAQDLEQRALVLANIFRCMPDSELSRRTEADLLVKLEREITRLHKARGSGAKDAGSLLMELYPVLSPYTDSLDEVRSAYAARLREEADEYESQGATEAAIERLQVLALMYPSNGEYNRRISAIRAAQFSEFISKVSSITKFIGYGSLEVTGEVEGCVVTIEHLTREMGDLVMDTRISKSIALMNGLYKLQFEREGYKPIVKNVAVEADKKLEVEVTEDEWEKLEQ